VGTARADIVLAEDIDREGIALAADTGPVAAGIAAFADTVAEADTAVAGTAVAGTVVVVDSVAAADSSDLVLTRGLL
jgi:hypothetical protein